MPQERVSILGCGWLGLPLAQRLMELGHAVKGSTTSPEKKSLLEHKGIKPYLIHCTPEIDGVHVDDFFQSEILFLNIPFSRKLSDPAYYREQIRSVLVQAEQGDVRTVIFTGSTSIYPEVRGIVYEDEPLEPAGERARVLAEIEEMLFADEYFQTTVLRLGGLYGAQRKIGKFLSGKTALSDGAAPVNLIHLDDCVEIITRIIERRLWGEVFNLCSDEHPTRAELYTKAAEALGLPPPVFADAPQTRFKIVSNEKVKMRLGYHFRYPDPAVF